MYLKEKKKKRKCLKQFTITTLQWDKTKNSSLLKTSHTPRLCSSCTCRKKRLHKAKFSRTEPCQSTQHRDHPPIISEENWLADKAQVKITVPLWEVPATAECWAQMGRGNIGQRDSGNSGLPPFLFFWYSNNLFWQGQTTDYIASATTCLRQCLFTGYTPQGLQLSTEQDTELAQIQTLYHQ